MRLLSSLTNRIFLASALLAVLSIAAAIYNVNAAVTTRAEAELARGLEEAATLVDEYRRLLFAHFSREARLVADLPRLKAAVAVRDRPTVQPIAAEYWQQLDAAILVVTDPAGRVLGAAGAGAEEVPPAAVPAVGEAALGREAAGFLAGAGGILQLVSVPIWIDPRQPEILGTLSVAFSFDNGMAERFKALTNSEVAFALSGRVLASTLPPELWAGLERLLADGAASPATLGGEDYAVMTRALGPPDGQEPRVLILRSRTERLRFLSALHRTLAVTAVIAVLLATLLSYAIARTITRPLATVTATMREMAATGDLTRRIPDMPAGPLQDEDARVLAATFNRMTDSIARFQREAADRERLSSLGRLSTVIAHEVRNPLMIIKVALRALQQPDRPEAERRAAITDIDGEIVRLNRLVTDVLDFARPIAAERAPTDLNALCADALRAVGTEPAVGVRLALDPALPPALTDAERLRLALVNVLTNARHAVLAGPDPGAADAIEVATSRRGSTVAIEVRDRGTGIAEADLPKIFDPYFTTRRAGTGLGLAISRNIVEGLGGTIAVAGRPGGGTTVRLELPVAAEAAATA